MPGRLKSAMKVPSPRSSGQSSLRRGEAPMPCSSTAGDTNRRDDRDQHAAPGGRRPAARGGAFRRRPEARRLPAHRFSAQADGERPNEVHPRVSAVPMEGRGVVATADGVVYTSTQAPHLVADAIAECIGSSVRVVTPDVGGGFGQKIGIYTDDVLLAWIARRLKATVKWVEDRSEHMQASSHARAQKITFSAAVRSDVSVPA